MPGSLRASGVIVDELGPDTFLAEIRKIWEENTPHLSVATLLDWFASYVYLPRLRDDVTLTNAIEKLAARIDFPAAFAEHFDEMTGEFHGVSECSLGLTDVAYGFLVWRKVLPQPDETTQGESAGKSVGETSKPTDKSKSGSASDEPSPAHMDRRAQGHRAGHWQSDRLQIVEPVHQG
jgi:hypothetical protein